MGKKKYLIAPRFQEAQQLKEKKENHVTINTYTQSNTYINFTHTHVYSICKQYQYCMSLQNYEAV